MRQETEHHKGACSAENALADHGDGLQEGRVRVGGQRSAGSNGGTWPTTLSASTLRMISPTCVG
jgi:hypothetical protein